MKRFLILVVVVIAGVSVYFIPFSPAYAVDTAPPDPVKDLRMESSTDSSVTMAWTAPGDDGMSGTVSQYDMRMDTRPINPDEALLAPVIGGEPDPAPGGETQRMTIIGLTPSTTYWFAVRAQDRVGNVSPFSNVASSTTAFDTTPPEFQDLHIIDLMPTSARVIWKSGEPSTSEVRYGTNTDYGLFASSNSLVIDHSLPLGGLAPATLYYYQLTSKDQYENEAKTVNMTFETPLAASTTAPSTPAATPTSSAPQIKKDTPRPMPSLSFSPKMMNLKSKGRWITAVLRMPQELRAGLDFNSLQVNGKVKPSQDFNRTAAQAVLSRYGTLWLKFSRAELASLVPPDVKETRFTLTGTAKAGSFTAAETLKVENNISKAEWEKREEMKRKEFEAHKQKRIGVLEKAITELMKKLENLQKQLEKVRGEAYQDPT